MKKACICLSLAAMICLLNACSKKTAPGSTTTSTTTSKPVAAKKIKTPIPKVIVVNDSVASKTFDGRLYYDLEGHRYWRNNKDGKYYIFNKSMATDPNFKKP